MDISFDEFRWQIPGAANMYDDTLHQADDDECFTQIVGTHIFGRILESSSLSDGICCGDSW